MYFIIFTIVALLFVQGSIFLNILVSTMVQSMIGHKAQIHTGWAFGSLKGITNIGLYLEGISTYQNVFGGCERKMEELRIESQDPEPVDGNATHEDLLGSYST